MFKKGSWNKYLTIYLEAFYFNEMGNIGVWFHCLLVLQQEYHTTDSKEQKQNQNCQKILPLSRKHLGLPQLQHQTLFPIVFGDWCGNFRVLRWEYPTDIPSGGTALLICSHLLFSQITLSIPFQAVAARVADFFFFRQHLSEGKNFVSVTSATFHTSSLPHFFISYCSFSTGLSPHWLCATLH